MFQTNGPKWAKSLRMWAESSPTPHNQYRTNVSTGQAYTATVLLVSVHGKLVGFTSRKERGVGKDMGKT